MELLGHRTANITLRHVEITQKDLQREFHLAQRSPRHLIPLPDPLALADPLTVDAAAIVERFSISIRLLDLFRQQNPASSDKTLKLLERRLVRVRSVFQNLSLPSKP